MKHDADLEAFHRMVLRVRSNVTVVFNVWFGVLIWFKATYGLLITNNFAMSFTFTRKKISWCQEQAKFGNWNRKLRYTTLVKCMSHMHTVVAYLYCETWLNIF